MPMVHVEPLNYLVRIGEPTQIGDRTLPEISSAFNIVSINEKMCCVTGMRGEMDRQGLHSVVDVLTELQFEYLLSYGHRVPTARPVCVGGKALPGYWLTDLDALRQRFSLRRRRND